MAKLEMKVNGNLDEFVSFLKREIVGGNVSASLEEEARFTAGGTRISVLAFERYSVLGKNRVGMTVTVAESGTALYVVGITLGGSQAVFFKLNTLGEGAFLEKLSQVIDKFNRGK